MDVEVGSVLSSPVPGGFMNTISLTYATGGNENNFVIHLGAPCCTPIILSLLMIPVSGST